MNQQQIHKLLDVPERTLRDWKKGNRGKLYKLLETLDYDTAQQLLNMNSNMDLKRLVENEQYFTSLREFEKSLYGVLVSGRDAKIWLELSRDASLSKAARARSAYLYSFLTQKVTKLSFKTKVDAGFYHTHNGDTGNGLARLYGLKNGIDMQRFNQYKMTGRF
jgi:plasmid maintenance system antidote protein VapI